MLTACTAEYGASELAVSDQGAFVERGTDDLLNGVVVIEKNTGERLTAKFNDGVPSGDVEMKNAAGEIVLRSNFVPKKTQRVKNGFGLVFINERLEKGAASLTTDDYVDLFEQFAEYDGDYLRIGRGNKKTIGHYDHGEQLGRWQVYCENKQLESDRTFARQTKDDGKESIIKIGHEQVNTCDGDVLLSAKRDQQGRLHGPYIENKNTWSGNGADKPLPKYLRHYLDGEFDGQQKEFDHYGLLKIHNQFSKGVKQGVEKVYSSSQHYQTKELEHWLVEVKNYVNGQRHGGYSRYDKKQRVLASGQYDNDQPVGTWQEFDHARHSKQLVDYDANNFILEKAKAFQEACYFPKSNWAQVNWAKNKQGDLGNCEYYVEQGVVDINKKMAMDKRDPFQKSSHWTYPAVIAAPPVYEYMKKHGLKTRVADSDGRTRLHTCLIQLRAQNKYYPRCNAQQAIAYMDEVNIDSVSNTGTALHQIALSRNYSSKRPAVVNEELSIAESLIAKGADIDLVNHQQVSPLMLALGNNEYALAEILLDAGASVAGRDSNEKSTLAHFFLDARNRWRQSKVSAQGVRVLAKMVALGVDTNEPVFDGKNVRELAEESNTLHHIQTLKEANAMAEQFRASLGAKAQERRLTQVNVSEPETATPVTDANELATSENITPNDRFAEVSKSLFTSEEETAEQGIVEQTQETTVVAEPATENRLEPQQNANQAELDAQALLREQADFLVAQAKEHIAHLRLKTPKNNSALGSLEQLKRIDPEHPTIVEIERSIGEKYLGLALSKIKQGHRASAQKHLNSASEFIKDQTVLSEYQAKVEAISTTQKQEGRGQSSGFACKPEVKVIGIPMLGRTLIARQSLPLTKQQIMRKSLPEIRRSYSNIQQQRNGITFQQATKGKPIKFELDVMRDGNNTQLSVKAKTPSGFLIKKGDYKKAFCDLLATF